MRGTILGSIGLSGLVVGGLVFAGWLTHVIVTIQMQAWIFLLAGAIFAPVGVIHGWGLWFGIFSSVAQ